MWQRKNSMGNIFTFKIWIAFYLSFILIALNTTLWFFSDLSWWQRKGQDSWRTRRCGGHDGGHSSKIETQTEKQTERQTEKQTEQHDGGHSTNNRKTNRKTNRITNRIITEKHDGGQTERSIKHDVLDMMEQK